MKICQWRKDGGEESHVHGFFLVEIKSLFSIVLLRFSPGTRDAYHSHAFDSWSWLLRGRLDEKFLTGWGALEAGRVHLPSIRPIKTFREHFHQVSSEGTSWVLSFRGRWSKRWLEYVPGKGRIVLANGRKEIT